MAERKTKNRQSDRDATIRYLITKSVGEDVIVEIPAHWKVTFGYVNPNPKEGGFGNTSSHCVRMYEGEKLRMVEGNATGLRDLSVPFARKFEKQSGESTWSNDSEGNFKSTTEKQIETSFVVEGEDVEEVFSGNGKG